MSFQEPWRLALVIAPVALFVAYLIVQRQRRKYTVRFTSVDLLASVAPRRPGWQRHVSAALVLAAVLALVVGLARPATTKKVAKERGTIMLVMDTSGSMAATDVAPTRLAAAQEAARRFVEGLPPGLQIGLLSFDSTARLVTAPSSDHAPILGAISALSIGGGTATGVAIEQSLNAINAIPVSDDGKKAPAAIVLMSDGAPTIGNPGLTPEATVTEATAKAKTEGVPINTIAFGTPDGTVESQGETIPVPADPQTMSKIASDSDGKSFTAASGQELNSVYEQIRRSVGYDNVKVDRTMWFVAMAFLVLLLAGTAGLLWLQRIP